MTKTKQSRVEVGISKKWLFVAELMPLMYSPYHHLCRGVEPLQTSVDFLFFPYSFEVNVAKASANIFSIFLLCFFVFSKCNTAQIKECEDKMSDIM